jgi:hypothetical protein
MKMPTLSITFIAGALFTLQTQAETMECGTHMISDGEISGPILSEVVEKCGEPTSRDGNSYVYEKGNTTYVLVFDDAGNLNSISITEDD